MVDGKVNGTPLLVYLSFDRKDHSISHSFVSHLSAEFHRRKISVSSRQSDAAIANARASVVIFSEGFVKCRELHKLFERRCSTSHVVVPVLYGGLTKSRLVQLCIERDTWFPKASWTDLFESYDLERHSSSHNQSDSELVEEIVADVRDKLDLTGKIGIYSRLIKIENLICKQPLGVQSLGIWGMGGIGKTTLAEAAYKQMSGDFEVSCMIQDFSREFQKKGVYGLLKEHFGEKESCVNSPVKILSLLRENLRNKRTLLVLDDVHKPLGATTFLGWFDSLGVGSLVIITSRDRQVLVHCRVKDIYKVQGLNTLESLQQLFYLWASEKDVRDRNLQELAKKLVDYANGNPLALSIYGSKLKGKTLSKMESAVLECKQTLCDEIFDVFKSSYDALSDCEKNIFLDIVCFFRGESVDNVIDVLAECGFFARVGIDILVDRSLLSVSQNIVQMHNLIHQFGLQIISNQADEIEKGYRLVETSNNKSLLQEKEIGEAKATCSTVTGNEYIEALILGTSNIAFEDHIELKKMYNLRYLKIYSSSPTGYPRLHLPNGLQTLPSGLRLLHWENYPLQSLPQDFDMQHLVELNMPYSQLQKLWEGTKNLEMLKRVTLCHSHQLLNIDELQFSRNIKLINLQGCSRLQSFPDTSHLQHLEVVNLSFCVEIRSFPKVPPCIRKLDLQGTKIQELSENTASLVEVALASLEAGEMDLDSDEENPIIAQLADRVAANFGIGPVQDKGGSITSSSTCSWNPIKRKSGRPPTGKQRLGSPSQAPGASLKKRLKVTAHLPPRKRQKNQTILPREETCIPHLRASTAQGLIPPISKVSIVPKKPSPSQ